MPSLPLAVVAEFLSCLSQMIATLTLFQLESVFVYFFMCVSSTPSVFFQSEAHGLLKLG